MGREECGRTTRKPDWWGLAFIHLFQNHYDHLNYSSELGLKLVSSVAIHSFLAAFCHHMISTFPYTLSDYKKGFGGKYGVQSDRVDKSAVGWEDKGTVAPHESQTGRSSLIFDGV